MAADLMGKWANHFNPRRRLFAEVERKLLTSAEPPVVLCLSDYVKKNIREHYELPPDRLATLFNAVDLKRFDPKQVNVREIRGELQIDESQIVALMVAQDFARKGLRQAIEAVAQVADPWLLLLVVGKDNPGPYAQLAARLNIAKQVRFIGAVSDPWRYYAAADFFVLPTRHDPCSLVVLESLAMGVPVISTIFNGACQIMENGSHGAVLSDPQDVSALGGAMRNLLDPAARQGMREACLALRSELSFDAHVDRLLAIYSSK
jgi:UDP-glucose:(heptosyl)LPS alpha-1,3-glucosyltransferase